MFAIAVCLGALAAWHYARAGLTLSHYDARSHLVVARRVIDSFTPGWRQFGAVWLPVPHILNLLPVQWDWSYRTGFSGIAISIGGLAWGLAAFAQYLVRHGASIAAAVIAPLAILLNPDVLYLQSTPLTEALLFGFSLGSLASVDAWVGSGRARDGQRAGVWLTALVLTRYEGWLIGAALVALGLIASRSPRTGAVPLVAYPATAVLAFMALSFASTGVWLVTGGFFTPNNPARGSWVAAFSQVFAHTRALAGPAIMLAGVAGVGAAVVRAAGSHARSLLPLALLAAAVLPLTAFHAGHPERVRYMVAVAVAAAALAGLGLTLLPLRAQIFTAVAFLSVALGVRPPLSTAAPMVTEAQWELPFRNGRRAVTEYLRAHYDNQPLMASMGSLAHYMQDLAAIELPLRDFVHEGNGDLWRNAMAAPRRYVGWILIEEQALDGDMLARHVRRDTAFLAGFERVASGGGLALYRAQ